MDINKFVDEYTPLANSLSEKLGVAPHVLLAQWGLETGWGRSVVPGTNNLGNVKDFSGNGTSAVDNQTGTTDKYKQFDSPEAFGDHFAGLLSRKYAPALNTGADSAAYATALKQGGYAEDPAYVNKVVSASDKVLKVKLDRIGNQVIQALRDGHTVDQVAQGLVSSPTIGGDVHDALLAGVPAEKIIAKVAGDKYQDFLKSDPTYGMSTVDRALAGAGKKATEWGAGAKEAFHAITGDEAGLAQDRADTAERNRLDAPLMNTTAGKFGYGAMGAAPAIGMAVIAPETLLGQMAMGGAVGGVEGAIKPTTQDGERFGNIVEGAGWGAGGAGVGYGIGKGIGKVLSKFGASPEEAAAVEARMAAAKEQGLPVTASAASGPNGFARAITDSMPNSGTVVKAQGAIDDALSGKIAEGLGINGYVGPINHDLLNTARTGIKQALDNATNVQVVVPKSLSADIGNLVANSANPLTEGIATNSVVNQVARNVAKAAEGGKPVGGSQLQELASELKDLVRSQAASATERKIASQVVDKINSTLLGSMTPEQAAAFLKANKQYANLKAVEKMVAASNDAGTVLPRQIVQAVKSGSFKNQFMRGEAPYQELGNVAMDLYGPAANKGLNAAIAKGLDQAVTPFELGYSVTHPVAGAGLAAREVAKQLLARAATSENPAVVKLMTGTTSIQKAMADPKTLKAIAKALAATGGASTTK